MQHLTKLECQELFREIDPNQKIEVIRIRYKNKQQIRIVISMSVTELISMIHTAIDEGHQYGGNLEIILGDSQTLVGHHDGLYWLEKR